MVILAPRMATKRIEIFKAGRHTAMGGETIEFSASDLDQIARSYNPKLHEAPIVLGHPAHNAPAFGWAKALVATAGVLAADCDQFEPAFLEAARDGRYKKVSASFYKPDSTNNPTPGQWYLRHIGFLGAQPPAVKGLRETQFAGGGEDCVTVVDFGDLDVANLLRSLREFLIAEFGVEKADKAMPPWDVTYTQNQAAIDAAKDSPTYAENEEAATAAADAAGAALTDAVVADLAGKVVAAALPAVTASLTEALVAGFPELDAEKLKAALDTGLSKLSDLVSAALTEGAATLVEPAKEAVLKALPAPASPAPADAASLSEPTERERQLEREVQVLRRRERDARKASHASFLDTLAAEGRRLPAKRALVVELLELAAASDASFADGGEKATPLELVKRLLSKLPKEVDLSERGAGDFSEGDDGPHAVAAAAAAYQAEQAKLGNHISTSAAVNHVKGKH